MESNISNALKSSEYLIVICSIESAKSFWVNQEIVDFKQLHGEDKVLAIILDGEPNATSKSNFTEELECFPKALKYKVIDGQLSTEKTEPIAADVRSGKDGYKFAKLKLIAGLLGVGLEELYQREIKRQKRKRWVLIGIVSSVLAVISLLALNLFFEKNRVEEESSKVKSLLFKGEIKRGLIFRDYLNSPLKAKNIFLNSLKIQNSNHQKNVALILSNSLLQRVKLIETYEDNRSFYESLKNELNEKSLPSREHGKEKLVCCDKWNRVFFLKEKKTNKLLYSFKKPDVYFDNNKRQLDQQVKDVFFINNGKEFVSWDYASNINFWNREESFPTEVLHHGNQLNGVLFSKDETEILSWGNNAKVKLWKRKKDKPILEFQHNTWVFGAIFSQDEERILSWSDDGEIRLWSRFFLNLDYVNPLTIFKHADSVNGAIFSKDEKEILSWSDDRTAKLWNVQGSRPLAVLEHKSRVIGAKFIDKDKKIITWSADGEIKVWKLKNKKSSILFQYKERYDQEGHWYGSFNVDKNSTFYWSFEGAIKLYSLDGKKCFFNVKEEDFFDGASLSN